MEKDLGEGTPEGRCEGCKPGNHRDVGHGRGVGGGGGRRGNGLARAAYFALTWQKPALVGPSSSPTSCPRLGN